VLAGPIYNFILAFFVFSLVGLFIPKQSDMVSAQIKDLSTESFYQVEAINDTKITNVQSLQINLLDLTGYSGDIDFELYDYANQKSINYIRSVEDLKFSEGQAPTEYFDIVPFADFKPRIGLVADNSPAELIGLKSGDIISSINNQPVISMYQATSLLNVFGEQISLEVYRDDKKLFFTLPSKTENESFGLSLAPESNDLATSLGFGYDQTRFWIVNTFKFLYKTLNGTMGFENLSGPVGIAKVAGDSLLSGAIPFLLLLGILSISLGAFNLLPLPMLDGGQFLIILVEKVKGSPLSLKLKATLMNLSFLLVLTLFVFVMVNDIARII